MAKKKTERPAVHALDLAQEVFEHKQSLLFRASKREPGRYERKGYFDGSRSGWTLLDLFSASCIVAIAKAPLSPENRAKFEALPLKQMALVALRLCAEKRS